MPEDSALDWMDHARHYQDQTSAGSYPGIIEIPSPEEVP